MIKDLKARDIHVIDLSEMGQDYAIMSPQLLALRLSGRKSPLDVGVIAFSVRGRFEARRLQELSATRLLN